MSASGPQTGYPRDSVARRKKSVTRAFRFDEDLDRSLWQEAERQMISANALANKILREYVEHVEIKEQIGWVQIPKFFLLSLIESVPEDHVSELGGAIGIEVFKQLLLGLSGRTDSASFMRFLPKICEVVSSGLGTKIGVTEEAGQHAIVCYHSLGGSKLSNFLASFISGAIEKFAGEKTITEITENSFSVRFRAARTS